MEFQALRIDHTEQIALGERLVFAGGRGVSSRRDRYFGFFAASSRAIECRIGTRLDGHIDRCRQSPFGTMGANGSLGIGD